MKNGADKKRTKVDEGYELSCGNVFEDLGLPNPEALLAKATLAHRIHVIIAKCKLTQRKAAEILKIDQPKVSALIRGQLDGFSMERLFRFLNILGQSVEVVIRPKRSKDDRGLIRVKAG
jgi:predicted XRE-type DNA-binding protein